MNANYRRIALLIIRIILGLLFLVSGVGKLINNSDAQYLVELLATKFFWLIEYKYMIVISVTIIELILSVLLLWGRYLKTALTGSFLLLLSFTAVLSYFYFTGMTVEECGCFGAFGGGGGTVVTLLRDVVLILLVIAGFVLANKKDPLTEEPAA
ncbi:MAG TPA: MauE/DoxX family redox-associated membrane protein [Balneolaceae bacterium]|nr:MauE/DoxX family redox-associated membrane protein [Balneolaceae bacterium]